MPQSMARRIPLFAPEKFCIDHEAAPTQFVVNQHVTGQQRKQQDPLEYAGNGAWHAQAGLRQFATDIEQGHDEAGKYDAYRMQATDISDDDRGEAITG